MKRPEVKREFLLIFATQAEASPSDYLFQFLLAPLRYASGGFAVRLLAPRCCASEQARAKGTIRQLLKYIRPFTFYLTLLLFLLSSFSLSACHDDNDDSPYPNLITEMADCPTNSDGTMAKIVLDDDTELPLSNPQTGLKANAIYRCLAGYTLDNGQATLYNLKSAYFLRDSSNVATCDPTNIASMWHTRRYLNLHLLPKTQGGTHAWGVITDSIVNRHAYLRLHHRQGNDPTAYTTDVYASLPLALVDADTITLRIRTFSGTKEQTFPQ